MNQTLKQMSMVNHTTEVTHEYFKMYLKKTTNISEKPTRGILIL